MAAEGRVVRGAGVFLILATAGALVAALAAAKTGVTPAPPKVNLDGTIAPTATAFDTYDLYKDPATGRPIPPLPTAAAPVTFGSNPYKSLAPKPGFHWDGVAQKQVPDFQQTPRTPRDKK